MGLRLSRVCTLVGDVGNASRHRRRIVGSPVPACHAASRATEARNAEHRKARGIADPRILSVIQDGCLDGVACNPPLYTSVWVYEYTIIRLYDCMRVPRRSVMSLREINPASGIPRIPGYDRIPKVFYLPSIYTNASRYLYAGALLRHP